MTLDPKKLAQDLVAQLKAAAVDEHELEVALTQVHIAVLEEMQRPHPSNLDLVQRNQKALRNAGAEKVLRDRAAATGTTYQALVDAAAAELKVRSDVIEPMQVLAAPPAPAVVTKP